jgi:salicylate hydroxylase
MSKQHVLIAGGGMGGLVAALALLKRGIDVDLYEQAPELRELGSGLWVSPNGARVLHGLGLKDAIDGINTNAKDRVVRLWDSGQSWSVYSKQTGTDHNLIMVLRSEMHRVLVEAVQAIKPDAFHLNAKVAGFTQDQDGVQLHLEDGRTATGTALVGADGLHSKVRAAAFGPSPGRFTNAIAWRGLVPMENLAEHHRLPVASTWLGPTAHVTSYPVRKGDQEFVSFSGQAETTDWTVESWSEMGSIEDCLKDFSGWHQDIVDLVKNAQTLYKWGLFIREPLPQWSVGRVTLLGDACHSMVPYLGQGVNMAFEDAAVLARCLELGDAADTAASLQRYSQARAERGAKTVDSSLGMQYVFHNDALAKPDTAIPYVNQNWSVASMKERYDWLFGYDANSVPV